MALGSTLITTILLVHGTPTLTPGTIAFQRQAGDETPVAQVHWVKKETWRMKPLSQIVEPSVLRTKKGDSIRVRIGESVVDIAQNSGVAVDGENLQLAYGTIQIRTNATAMVETPISRVHIDHGDTFIRVYNAEKSTGDQVRGDSFVSVVQKRGRTTVEAFKVLKSNGTLYGQSHIIPGAGKYLARGRSGVSQVEQSQAMTLESYEKEYAKLAPEFTRGLTEASRLFAMSEIEGSGVPKRDFSGANNGNRAIASQPAVHQRSLFRRAIAPSQNLYGGNVSPSGDSLKKNLSRSSGNTQNW